MEKSKGCMCVRQVEPYILGGLSFSVPWAEIRQVFCTKGPTTSGAHTACMKDDLKMAGTRDISR